MKKEIKLFTNYLLKAIDIIKISIMSDRPFMIIYENEKQEQKGLIYCSNKTSSFLLEKYSKYLNKCLQKN